jgi:NADH:ubiquinone reductase (H+-translocating)
MQDGRQGRRPHVVIVGGGFGGLRAARALHDRPVRITVVDRHNHHLFQPLLYQVATAALSPGDIAAPIRGILRSQRNARVLLGEVESVDVAHRVILVSGRAMRYDYLVLATGARHGYFAHPEWEWDAPGLKTIEDALEIRRRVLTAYERAEHEPDEARRDAWMTFVIVGGGPTGVELAGALAEIATMTLAHDFRRIDPRRSRIMLLEGGPRLLPSFPEDLSAAARAQLEQLGVEVRTGALVTAVSADGVAVGDEAIAARTVLWAAGVVASPLARSLGVPLDRPGRVIVEPDLSIPGHREVFVIGDLASFSHQTGQPLPGVAPVAMQQGTFVAAAIAADLDGRPRGRFVYRDRGNLATIGRAAGVADFGRVRLHGLVAWLAWLVVHISFLIGFENRLLVMLQWAWAYVTYERGARLITGSFRPPGSARGGSDTRTP